MSRNRVLFEKMLNKYTAVKLTRIEKKKVSDPRRQALIAEVQLTPEQSAQIDDLYKDNYGRKISHDWHRLYQSFTGRFQVNYFPELLFSTKAEPAFNPWSYRYVLDDKLLISVFTAGVHGVHTPDLIGGYTNGVYYDSDHNVRTKKQFALMLDGIGDCFFKQTKDTDSGKGVQLYKFVEGIAQVEKVIDSYTNQSFVVQKLVKQHKSLSDIYPLSVNTFRVVTYVWNGKIFHFPVSLRLGRNGNRVDNAHAGGIFVGLTDDGKFMDSAFTEMRDTFYEHPNTGFVFKGASLPYIPDLIVTAEKMHVNALCLGMISWDLTVDETGTFVLIEANTNGQTVWFPQMSTGVAAFGDNTADILKWLRKK